MTDQDNTTESSTDNSQENIDSRLDTIVEREVVPVHKRDRSLARLFTVIVCLVLVAFGAGGLIKTVLLSEPVQPQSAPLLFHSAKIAIPERLPHAVVEQRELPATVATEKQSSEKVVMESPSVPPVSVSATPEVVASPMVNEEDPPAQATFDIVIGPFITKTRLQEGENLLKSKGLLFVNEVGSGPITMIRLREGVYAPEIARKHLETIKQAGFRDSFVLPSDGKLAVYAGSFVDPKRADVLTRELAEKNIRVVRVSAELSKQGNILKLKDLTERVCVELERELSIKGIHVHRVVVK